MSGRRHLSSAGAKILLPTVLLVASQLAAVATLRADDDCSSDLLPEQQRLLEDAPEQEKWQDPAEFAARELPIEASTEENLDDQTGIRLEIGDKILRAESGQLVSQEDGRTDWQLNNAVLLLPPFLFQVEELRINQQSGEVSGTDILFWRGNTLSGSAESLRTRIRTEPEEEGADGDLLIEPVEIESFRLSLCGDISAPGWGLRGSSLRLDTLSSLAEVRGVSLLLLGVPLPGPPLARLPLDGRSISGFLTPIFNLHNLRNNNELDITLPYLLPLGPSADLTLAPRSIEGVGIGLETELRYLTRINQGKLSVATLDREQDHLRALRWRHALQPADNLHLNLDYTEADRTLVTDYPPASVDISSRGGLNRQALSADYRLLPLSLSLLSERYEGPFNGTFGDYRRDLEAQLHLQRRQPWWGWHLSLENTRFSYGQETLFLGQQVPDRPLGAVQEVQRTLSQGHIALHPQTSWGWARLQLATAQVTQDAAGFDSGSQGSTTATLAGGLHFTNDTGSLYLQPELSYRAVDFSASGQKLQNLDGSLFPAFASLPPGVIASGSDILPARDHLGLKLNLHYRGPGKLNVSAAAAFNDWGAAEADSLLLTLEPELSEPERTQALSLQLRYDAHTLIADGNRGGRLYDNSRRLAYSWRHSMASLALGRFWRDQGGGRNDELDQDYLKLGLHVTSTWHISGYVNRDRQRDRETSHGLSVSYNSCCIAFTLAARDYLHTDYSRVTNAHWLEWETLPVAMRDAISFSLQLKADYWQSGRRGLNITP